VIIDDGWVPHRSPHVHTAVLDGEAVLYDDRTHDTLRLNSSGTAIWDAVDGRTSVYSIVHELARRHSMTPDDIVRDVHDVLHRLVIDGAVVAGG
jgi:hypothetical protein